jgi:hypothetical protein
MLDVASTLVWIGLAVEVTFRAGALVIFPLFAVRIHQTGGAVRLRIVAMVAVAVVVVYALAGAAPAFGNRVAAREGYWITARDVVILVCLPLGLPILSVTLAVSTLVRRGPRGRVVLVITLLTAWASYFLGSTLAVALLYWIGHAPM